MIDLIATIMVLYVLRWVFIIIVGILALILLLRIIVFIVDLVSAKKAEKAEKTYGKDSIGALVARNKADASRGDYNALLNTSDDRKQIKDIVDWFNDVVANRKYVSIRETEAEAGEPNYAFVMDNNSGYDFKEFSCVISLEDETRIKSKVVGTAKNWKNSTQGMIWFYCNGIVSKATIDVRSIKYVIDRVLEEDEKPSAIKPTEVISSKRPWDLTDSKYDDIDSDDADFDDMDSDDIDIDDIDIDSESDNDWDFEREREYEPYICPECSEPYDGIYCENCGHSNDTPGYEEVSEYDKWFEDMTAIALIDAEERRNKAFRSNMYDDEFEEDDF